jgi:putative heme-binding domain-containing protein
MREPGRIQSDMQLIGRLLTPQTPNRVQQAIVARVATRNEKQIAALLLGGWRAHGPRLRAEILSVVASRPSWVQTLTERLNSGEVSAAEIDAAMRQRLLATKNKPLRARLKKAFSSASDADRQQVVMKYQSALELSGDTKRGAALFTKHCANCHRHAGVGHEVGPNLASITTKTPQSLLTSMLDPSAAVEAKYLNYIAISEDGRSFSGMIATETGSSITLLAAEGKRQSLLRNEIETMQSSGKSLMPDGIEKDLSPQDVADLIEFVRNLSATK